MAQQTQLRIAGHYTTTHTTNDTYTVELYDGSVAVDKIDYRSVGGKVYTPQGYTKDCAGARQHARDYWM